MPRRPPWDYPRDSIPASYTLKRWRRRAAKLARELGAKTACGICKRPVNQWGNLRIRHPHSYGKSRHRRICLACTNLLQVMVEVLEWYGASDNLPPETFAAEDFAWDPEQVAEDLYGSQSQVE